MTNQEAIQIIGLMAYIAEHEGTADPGVIREAAQMAINALKERMPLDEINVLGDAIQVWGQRAQQAMLLEEMSELQKEICKNWRGRDNVTEIAEEIADVEICLDQLKMMLCCAGRVRTIRASKIRRLEERIREAKT